ncbi:MAG: inorganic phosphate transporter [Armatimonadetes bacterium]|nr:inorganic phosphate transporter [Armatimonadota bacterium]NIM24320.1 inorganic phosphate transporter [Armatimonadota bacterium]NIM68189.1 inorganic phosphate transporter [Armatimonadota bacterium]NIM76649.1 inorganic phosphate transporter [Armatimonadota bacterium]NIN06394.1 inorganic phosphate transporter [Armatimonadota bacterium]
MFEQLLPVLPILLLILAAEFVNGFTDAPNAIATVVSTRVLHPHQAIVMAVMLNIIGALCGTAVAATIGKDIVSAESINALTIGAAMIGIVIWSTLAWVYGLPTSESHALVAGLAGATLATAGPSALLWVGWKKVIIGIGFSTFLGFFGGVGLMLSIQRLMFRSSRHKVNRAFGRLQILSSAFMAFGHGSNDAQKFMGVFALTLVLGGIFQEFHVPVWVILICALTMGVGTAFGGWRIIRTMGMKLTRLQPVHGFAAETSAGLVIAFASTLGIPLSTTHTINTAIMGVGSTRRLSAVRWGVGGEIVMAWILTFPVCGFIAWLVAWIGKTLF